MRLPPPLRGLRAAFVFLTRIPVGGFPYRPDDFRWAAAYFPAVGACVGALSGAVASLARPAGPWPAALLALGASLLLTGAFHEDGLADTADALGGAFDRAKLFAILKDSRVGSFGAAALFVVLALRAALLARLVDDAVAACALAGALARTPPVVLMVALPYVTDDAASRSRLLTRARPRQAVAALGLAALALAGAARWGASPARLLALVVALAGASALCAWRFVARAGGLTGDFLGATEQVGECVVGLVLAWGRP
ncbi:MAG TPA: adenosylcobinamide-GDP ribazoletransferase [Polyangiaceae bacterium]|nr:adenosylcobinamide-GDP ribazoletransferase [Polyangiaceae bacterium]